jgi:hypothetical protein
LSGRFPEICDGAANAVDCCGYRRRTGFRPVASPGLAERDRKFPNARRINAMRLR